jgi:hypothetical protein
MNQRDFSINYFALAKRYHPDRNPHGAELMANIAPGYWSQWRGGWVPPHCAPNEYGAGWGIGIGEAQFLQRRFDEAIATLLTALEALPGNADI